MLDQPCGCHAAPHITPLDFFLWGFVKDYIESSSVDDIATLHAVIIEEIRIVVKGMLIHTWTKLYSQLDVIRTTMGFQFLDGCIHKLFELRSSLQKTANLSVLDISIKFLKQEQDFSGHPLY